MKYTNLPPTNLALQFPPQYDDFDLSLITVVETAVKSSRGRPKGSKNKRLKERTTSDIRNSVSSIEQIFPAVMDILWRTTRRLTAVEIVNMLDLNGIKRSQVLAVMNTFAHHPQISYSTETHRNGQIAKDKRMWEFYAASSVRTGWYWRGRLWSERELATKAKVSRQAIHKRLTVQGMTVDQAVKTERLDNAR